MADDSRMLDRRRFLQRSAAAVASGAAALALLPARAEETAPVTDPMRVPGALPRPYGSRSPFEKAMRLGGAGPGSPKGWGSQAPNNFNSVTPLHELHGIITP